MKAMRISIYLACIIATASWMFAETQAVDDRLTLKEQDINKDGQADNWLYSDSNGVPIKWISDFDKNGTPDNWSEFEDGQAFFDQNDTDNDGKVDQIVLNVRNGDKEELRSFMLVIEDAKKGLFRIKVDSGWIQRRDVKEFNKSHAP